MGYFSHSAVPQSRAWLVSWVIMYTNWEKLREKLKLEAQGAVSEDWPTGTWRMDEP